MDTDILEKIFRMPVKFLNFIANNSLFEILTEVSNFRNIWKGHNGMVSQKGYEFRLQELEKYLNKIYKLLSFNYKTFLLLKPSSMRKKNGVYYIKVMMIAGTRTPFQVKNIESLEEMEEDQLYFMH